MSTAYRTPARPPQSVPRRSGVAPAAMRRVSDRVSPTVQARPAQFRSPDRSVRTLPFPNRDSRVRQLPILRALPVWLRVLLMVQRSSTAIAVVLVAAMLIVYGSTVYTQQLWSKEYRKLKTSQRNERQLVSASEALKAQAAQQSERPGAGLVPQTPADLLFVQPSALRPQQSLKAAPSAAPASTAAPAGY